MLEGWLEERPGSNFVLLAYRRLCHASPLMACSSQAMPRIEEYDL